MFAGGPELRFEVEEIPTLPHSRVARVTIGGPEEFQRSLIYKRSSGNGAFLTVREARFYRGVAAMLPAGLTAPCLLAEEKDGAATIILEDISDAYRQCTDESPSLEEALQFVRALAALHAAGNSPDVIAAWKRTMGSGWYDTIAGRLSYFDSAGQSSLDSLRTTIDEWGCSLVARISISDARLSQFAEEQTILHGDAHYGNALYSPESAVLLDWGNACLGPGEIDLAHAVALNLPREVSREWEAPILHEYVRSLESFGVSRSFAEVYERYRMGALYAVTVPIRLWQAGVSEEIWRRLLRNVLAAVRDLDAESLLSASG